MLWYKVPYPMLADDLAFHGLAVCVLPRAVWSVLLRIAASISTCSRVM